MNNIFSDPYDYIDTAQLISSSSYPAMGGNRARLQHLALLEFRCRASQIAHAIVYANTDDLNDVDAAKSPLLPLLIKFFSEVYRKLERN